MPTVCTQVDEQVEILDNQPVAEGFYRMCIAAPTLGGRFQPGQFFQFEVPSVLLRRPFAPSEANEDGFAFIYAVVGEGTEAMTRLARGTTTRVLGPLGQGYTLPEAGQSALLIGGGCGTPSLRLLGERLESRGVTVYSVIGARSACTVLEEDALRSISNMIAISTDDGSQGIHGHAVSAAQVLLDEIGADVQPGIFACGPGAMLRGVAGLAAEYRLRCQVSLEERMACGFGACMGCAVKIRAENEDGFVYKRVCKDGPVFRAEELMWD